MTERLVPAPAASAAPVAGDLTAEWILDALWLAVVGSAGEGDDEPGDATGNGADEDTDDGDAAADQSRLDDTSPGPDEDEARPADSGNAVVPLRLGGKAHGQVPASEVGFGSPGPIRDPLALPRSLRRLRQVRRPGPSLEIDIDATVEATAEADGFLVPVLARRLERSLDLALVVDGTTSMRIWRETLDEFGRLLAQTGAFRSVSRWTLSARPKGVTVEDPGGTAHHPARLIDPSGQRLVFLATDATGRAWYEAGLWDTLSTWCAAMPVALIQMLPPDYWAATAIGGPPYLMGRATRPASPNAEYARRLGWWAADPGGEFLPVVTLAPKGMDGWARSAVSGTAWTAGVTTARPDPRRSPAPARAARTVAEPVALVGEFKSRASPGAERLARVLSSAPTLSAPLISILQRRLAPQTDVPELAEVLASGLIEEVPSTGQAAEPDDSSPPLLRFRRGVREILQRGTTTIDRWKAYDEVSKYLDDRQGAGGPLRARVADPDGDATMNAADEPFAELKHTLAVRLGLVSAVPERGESPGGHDASTAESPRAPEQEAPDTSAETEELLRAVLTEEIAALPDEGLLTLVDFFRAGAGRWTISRDEAGTPQVRQSAFQEHEQLDDRSPVILVCTSPDDMTAWVALNRAKPSRAKAATPAPRVFTCRAPMPDVLTEAIAGTPLTRGYELAVLRTSRSGRLLMDSVPLFQPGHRRGDRVALRVRIEPGGSRTVFAVLAATPTVTPDSLLVSAKSGTIPPGIHEITASLAGPGLVNFEGLPAPVRPDYRSWSAIAASVPEWLDTPEPAHLICAIDVSGGSRGVRQRVDAADRLITAAASEVPSLLVSIVSYGAHALERDAVDEAPAFLRWETNARQARIALDGLMKHQQSPREYELASRLECALAEIGGRLRDSDPRRRTVLITAGSRRPYPPALDKTQTLPCPLRRNWRLEEEKVRRFVAAFGAINDTRPDGEIWNYLARDARGLVDSLDVPSFLAALGLQRKRQGSPLPLLATAEAREAPEAGPAVTDDLGIVLLGPSSSGKTSLLAALNVAATQADAGWNVFGADERSAQFLIESTDQLISDRTFPAATLPIEGIRFTLAGTTTRTTVSRFRRRQEVVPVGIQVTMVDPPGSLFSPDLYGTSARLDIIDVLANSSGIIYTFDPIRGMQGEDSYRYLYSLIAQLSRRLHDNGDFSGKLPHYLAACITKFDDPRVLSSAERLGLITTDPDDPFEFPRVHSDDARELFGALLSLSPGDEGQQLINLIVQYFLPERVRYFVTSSAGFYTDPRNRKFNREDSQNVVEISTHGAAIRGTLHPINVAEPFIWLAEQITADTSG